MGRIGFGQRAGALIIDIVLVGILIAVVGPIVGGVLGGAVGSQIDGTKEMTGAGVVVGAAAGLVMGAPIIGSLYFLIEAFTGATFGKMMLGIKAGSADGTSAPTSKLLLRYVCKHPHFELGVAGIALPFLAGLGALLGAVAFFGCFAALGESKQALHDMIAKTAVFPKAALQPAAGAPPALSP